MGFFDSKGEMPMRSGTFAQGQVFLNGTTGEGRKSKCKKSEQTPGSVNQFDGKPVGIVTFGKHIGSQNIKSKSHFPDPVAV